MKAYGGHKDQRWGHVTYAQHGDDLMLVNLFEMLGIAKPSYLDVGAHDPTALSNTRLLYERGSRGVNVEANPGLVGAFRTERPDDVIVSVGIGPEPGVFPFYMYTDTCGLNTFCRREVEKLKHSMEPRGIKTLPVVTLDHTVAEFCNGKYPQLLLLDIEGFDYDVLSGAEFHGVRQASRSPVVICVETRPSDTARMRDMLNGKGYALYCRMGENLFFVASPFIEKAY